MIVKLDIGGVKKAKWHECVIRFLFGGAITAGAGVIGKEWGRIAAGLFLAFPAIFPASATLVEKHTRERMEAKGLRGRKRGTETAADDALGAVFGSVGLGLFACFCWELLSKYPWLLVLAAATLLWFSVSAVLWWFLRKRGWRRVADMAHVALSRSPGRRSC